jgi:hypothetical protein
MAPVPRGQERIERLPERSVQRTVQIVGYLQERLHPVGAVDVIHRRAPH